MGSASPLLRNAFRPPPRPRGQDTRGASQSHANAGLHDAAFARPSDPKISSARASDYGISASKYKQAAADELLIICQIESPKAVENIEAIAAVAGVDVLFIGPHDLSGSVGQLGDLKHPEVARLIARAEEGIKKSGKPMGTVPHPGTTWREMFQRGYQMINAGSDVGRLRDAALADVKEFRSVYP